MENNGKSSPDYRYSTIPDKMLTSSDAGSKPTDGRLQMKGSNIAWCGSTATASNDHYLQVRRSC